MTTTITTTWQPKIKPISWIIDPHQLKLQQGKSNSLHPEHNQQQSYDFVPVIVEEIENYETTSSDDDMTEGEPQPATENTVAMARQSQTKVGQTYECEYCSRNYKLKACFERHVRTHIRNNDAKKTRHLSSGTQRTVKHAYQQYTVSWPTKNLHHCNECGRSFRYKIDLQNHLLDHNAEKGAFQSKKQIKIMRRGQT